MLTYGYYFNSNDWNLIRIKDFQNSNGVFHWLWFVSRASLSNHLFINCRKLITWILQPPRLQRDVRQAFPCCHQDRTVAGFVSARCARLRRTPPSLHPASVMAAWNLSTRNVYKSGSKALIKNAVNSASTSTKWPQKLNHSERWIYWLSV